MYLLQQLRRGDGQCLQIPLLPKFGSQFFDEVDMSVMPRHCFVRPEEWQVLSLSVQHLIAFVRRRAVQHKQSQTWILNEDRKTQFLRNIGKSAEMLQRVCDCIVINV